MTAIVKNIIRTLRTAIPVTLFALWSVTHGLPADGDSLHLEILLSSKMLNDIHADKTFINSLEITSNRLILLSTTSQFYVLGWGGIVPLGKKVAGDISSYAYTADNLLMTIRNNELCVSDSLGKLLKLFKLPNKGMGISSGKQVMYVYDRSKNQQKYALYVIAKGGKYAKLFVVPAPIMSVVEMNDLVLFAMENGVFSFNPKNKELKALVALPKNKEIKSIAVDTSKKRIYFSTDSVVCALKDSSAVIIADKIGGMLRYFNNGLIVFNPEKKFLARMVGIENKIVSAVEPAVKANQTSASASNAPIPATTESVAPPNAWMPSNNQISATPINPISSGTTITPSKESSIQTNPVDSVKPIAAAGKETSVQPANIQIKDTVKETSKIPVELKTALPEVVPKETIKTESGNKLSIDESTFTINTFSYVNPLKQLITFYDSQFVSLTGFIQKWDRRIKDSLAKERQIKETIAQDEKVLADKKNANAGGFSNEIAVLKDKLSKDRDGYKRLVNNMVNDGKLLSDQLKGLGNKADGLIDNKFNEVIRMVVKSDPDPSAGDRVSTMTVTKRKLDTNVVNHVAPVTVILTCYENEIVPIRDTIPFWNEKVSALIQQDSKLAKQLEPLKKELLQYLSTPKDYQKVNKKQIADLKKQCETINDARERLAKQMADDSRKLSECLNQIKKEVRGAVKDRFIDAVENVDHVYETTPITPVPSGTTITAPFFAQQETSRRPIDEPAFTINTISYVNPLKRLITFYDSQFVSLTGFIQKWDRRIKDSLARERQIKETMAQDEKVLADKKNANARGFSNEIVVLKNKLSKDRDGYKRLENDMVNDGKLLSDQLKGLGKEADGLIDNKFNEVSRMVVKSDHDPSAGDTVSTITITKQKLDTNNLVNHVAPITVILACYENEIVPIRDTIALSNGKVLALIQQDSKLAKQLEPLKNELLRYLSTSKDSQKLNKKQIADLKKQCKAVENERKQLTKQMADDSRKLSECLDQIKEEVRGAVRDRFIDAVENIGHSYEDKF